MGGEEDETEVGHRVRRGGDADALATALAREARAPFLTAAKLLQHPDEEVRHVAGFILGSAEELCIEPLLAVAGAPPTDRAWAIRTVVAEETRLRADVSEWLGPFLKDRSVAAPPPGSAPRRICDEALVALRELVRFDEPALAGGFEVDKYLAMPERERDVLIAMALRSRSYRRAIGQEVEG